MKIYHDFIVNSQAPEIDKTLAPPVEIALDCNNISILEKTIVKHTNRLICLIVWQMCQVQWIHAFYRMF